jgi:hypothetical protein
MCQLCELNEYQEPCIKCEKPFDVRYMTASPHEDGHFCPDCFKQFGDWIRCECCQKLTPPCAIGKDYSGDPMCDFCISEREAWLETYQELDEWLDRNH